MKVSELFTTYWSQVTLLLFAIGAIINWVINLKSKKYEINHSLFQQNRLSSVNRYFDSYSKAVIFFNTISIYKVFNMEYDVKQMDNMTRPLFSDLEKNFLELKIYFDEVDSNNFKSININIISIHRRLSDLYFDYEPSNSVSSKVKSF